MTALSREFQRRHLENCAQASAAVARVLAELGASSLAIQYAMHVAWRGSNCWETDNEVRRYLKNPRGRAPHRETVARIRRNLARVGYVSSERVMPFQKPTGAKWRTAHGTTNKAIRYEKLGLRNPLTRAQRRDARAAQPTPATPAAALTPRDRPRFSAPTAIIETRKLSQSELESMLGPAWAYLNRQMQRDELERSAPASELERESGRGPPE